MSLKCFEKPVNLYAYEGIMRLSKIALVLIFIAACSAPQEPSVSVEAAAVEETPPIKAAALVEEPQAEIPDGDPVADGEWSPIPDAIAPDDAEPAIDLKMGDGYNSVKVNGRAPREERKPIKCKTVKDCAKMSIPKMPGERRCIDNTCVFVEKKIEIFEVL